MSDEAGDFWQPEKRTIYRYYNGVEVVAADPLRLQSGMASYDGLDVAFKIISGSDTAQSIEMVQDVAAHVRLVFGVGEIKETQSGPVGLTDQECLELLGHFFRFCASLKKNVPASPTSSPTSEPPASDAPSPTASSAVSPSTVAA